MATQNVNFKIKNTLEVLQDGLIRGNTTLAADASSGNLKTIVLGNSSDTTGQYTDINIFGDVTIKGSINTSAINSEGSLFPSLTNTYYLGDSSKKWLSLYSNTTNTNTLNVKNASEATTFTVDGSTGNTNISGTLTVTGTTTINDVVINGNVTVNGTTTTLNTATMTVDDKNIELGSTASPTDVAADGGGITLKGTTDKTILWVDATDSWTSNQNIDISSGLAYKIANTNVLTSTTLGSGVTASSLQSVGTLTSGTWNASVIAGQYGGTGVANTGKTITLGGNLTTSGAFATTLTTTNTTNVTLPTTGTLATLAGSEILSNKTLTAPKIVNGGFIADANGNENIIFTTTASAVNEVTLANAATGTNPSISASGTDTNVGINFIPKGTGKIQISGNEIATINSTQTFTNKTIDLGSNTLSGTVATIGTTAIAADGTQLTLTGLTSINGLSLTANTTGFSISGGTTSKTLTVNNSITLAGTDGTTITLPSSTGTVALNNQTMYIGTTAVAINRSSASLALTGISSIDGSAASLTTARTINGTSFNGTANITVEPYVEQDLSTAATRYLTFVDSSTAGYQRLNLDDTLNYNPSTGTLTTSIFSGSFSGSGASLTSLSADNISSGTLVVGRGGTGTTTAPTQGGIIFGSTASAYGSTAAGTTGQILTSAGTGTPTWNSFDLVTHAPDMSFKKICRLATTADLGASTFSSNVLTGYDDLPAALACTTTAGSTTITTTSTASIKVGAVVSVATVQLAAGTAIATINSATSFTVNNRANITTTAITGNGTTATATFATQTYAPYAVGSSITITGATPTTYNGTFTVTACTTTSVSWSSTETVTATVQGTIAFTIAAGTSISTSFKNTIAALSIDGVAVALNDRILVKDQRTLGGLIDATAAKYNGIYTVTAIGSTTVPWTLTRASDADSATDLDGAIVNISVGTANYGKSYKTRFKGTDTLNTTEMYWGRLTDINSSSLAVTPTTAVGVDIATDTETIMYKSGNVTDFAVNSIGVKTLQATAASTYTRASSLYIAGAPVASTNVTATNPYSIYVAGGNSHLGAAVTATSFNGITGLASSTSPMDGIAAVGTSTTAARQDHVHPSDTTKIGAANYASADGTVGGTIKARISGSTLYITTNGNNA